MKTIIISIVSTVVVSAAVLAAGWYVVRHLPGAPDAPVDCVKQAHDACIPECVAQNEADCLVEAAKKTKTAEERGESANFSVENVLCLKLKCTTACDWMAWAKCHLPEKYHLKWKGPAADSESSGR